jgi:hypothetical protein
MFTHSWAQQLAFPSAEGFGAYSKGGRGGQVLYVTNLNDDGPGSLRWAVEQEGPRTVVFGVSGTIELQRRLNIENPYLTIAGQTAPGDGICLKGETVKILTHDIVIRYLRVRLGDGKQGIGSKQGKDAIDISVGKDIIVDHCSASWSLDESLSSSTRNPTLTNVTVQWCFITEGLNPENHGFGSLIRGTRGAQYSYLHNLYAHNQGRNPRPGNYDANPYYEDPDGLLLDFRNNVIYNWGGGHAGYNNDTISVTRMNYVGNYLIPGANSASNGIAYSTRSAYNRAYFADNYYDHELPSNPWEVIKFRNTWTDEEIAAYKQNEAFDAGHVSKEDAPLAYQRVLATGGASLPKRDQVDVRIADNVKNRTGSIIKSQEEVGGWPELRSAPAPVDTDQDGMPDEWEKKNGLDPDNAADRNKVGEDGYTMLEEYLNSITSVSAIKKPRVFVLTDIENEPDDAMSMVRLLVYANNFDLEGLAATTSIHQKKEVASWRIKEIVAAYGKVRDNLEQHEPGFPTANYLTSIITEGLPVYGMEAVGEGKDSPASELLIKTVDKEDDRPVWVTAWGGPNVLAQALWKVRQTRSTEEVQAFVAKIRVYTISDQDDSGPWMRKEFPNLHYIVSPGFSSGGGYHNATWSGISGDFFHARCAGADFSVVTNEWLDKNIRNKGPLGEQYPRWEYLMEGDSPSFMSLISNGLSNPDHPEWGGWGGRYEWYTPRFRQWHLYPESRPIWTDAEDEVMGVDSRWHMGNHETIWRWRSAYQNDFAARMDWTIKEYEEANHPPIPVIAHATHLVAKKGDRVELSAKGSTDPDGDTLSYEWFYYKEAGTFPVSSAHSGQPVEIQNFDQPEAWFTVPVKRVAAPGTGTMHIILAVTDHGSPRLTRYQRVIVTIEE